MSHNYKLPAYSSIFINRADINLGDKIILHSTMLDTLLQRFGDTNLPNPMIFEITHAIDTQNKRITHCGVLEFSSDVVGCFLPQWLMNNLYIHNDGTIINLRVVELPLATKLVFKSLTPSFYTDIINPKATLENALVRFTALTEHDTIQIHTNNKVYDILIMCVEPKHNNIHRPDLASAVCLIDATVNVEFDSSDSVDTDGMNDPVNSTPQVPTLITAPNTPQPIPQIPSNQYVYYRYRTQPSPGNRLIDLQVTVQCVAGDTDIYVSTIVSNPKIGNNQYKLESINTTKTLTISSAPPDTTYYISLHAYNNPIQYHHNSTITIHEVESMSAVKTPTGGNITGQLCASDDTKLCNNCQRYINKKQYQMHELQCTRINVLCSICQMLIRRSEQSKHTHCTQCSAVIASIELNKHIDLTHTPIRCICNELYLPDELSTHQRTDCSMRMMTCQWCNLPVQQSQISDHTIYCGSKTIPCELCGKGIARKRMQIHYAVDHNINPSLRKSNIDELQHAINESKQLYNIHDDDDSALAAAIHASQLDSGMNSTAATHASSSDTYEHVSDEQFTNDENDDSIMIDDDWNDMVEESQHDHTFSPSQHSALQSQLTTPTSRTILPNNDWTTGTPTNINKSNTAVNNNNSNPPSSTHHISRIERGGVQVNLEIQICPYCQQEQQNYDTLLQHLQHCQLVE